MSIYNTFPSLRQGAWGTPELGLTELLTGNRTGQGGSDIIPNTTASSQAGLSQIPSFNTYENRSVLGEQTVNNGNPGGYPIVNPNPTTTTNTRQSGGGGGGNTGAGRYPADRYIGWDPASAQADWEAKARSGQTGGGGGQSIEDLISEQYAPALAALDRIAGSLTTGAGEARTNVESQYAKGGETIGREQGELEAALKEQGRILGESARSAYADATRAYNNLIQQGLSRFGAGSSAGPAVQELVNQEFLRSRGKMGQQQVAGEQQIAGEQIKLNNYISQKKGDLETWKTDAIQKINDNLRQSLADIDLRRGDIEANKTRDKIAALQSAVDRAEQVKTADQQYRLGLAQFAVEQMQTFANRAFTPQEISSIVNQMMNEPLALGERTAAPTALYRPTGYSPSREEEELARLEGGQA